MSKRRVFLPGEGWVPEDSLSGDALARLRDYAWIAGRPSGTLDGYSTRRKPLISRGIDLADVEREIASNEDIGPNQRKQMLREVRALADFWTATQTLRRR